MGRIIFPGSILAQALCLTSLSKQIQFLLNLKINFWILSYCSHDCSLALTNFICWLQCHLDAKVEKCSLSWVMMSSSFKYKMCFDKLGTNSFLFCFQGWESKMYSLFSCCTFHVDTDAIRCIYSRQGVVMVLFVS